MVATYKVIKAPVAQLVRLKIKRQKRRPATAAPSGQALFIGRYPV